MTREEKRVLKEQRLQQKLIRKQAIKEAKREERDWNKMVKKAIERGYWIEWQDNGTIFNP